MSKNKKKPLTLEESKKLAKPMPEGNYERQWYQCQRCKAFMPLDYVPYSLSNPILVPSCGHSFYHDLKAVGKPERKTDTTPKETVRDRYYEPTEKTILVPVKVKYHEPTDVLLNFEPPTKEQIETFIRYGLDHETEAAIRSRVEELGALVHVHDRKDFQGHLDRIEKIANLLGVDRR